MGAFAAATGRRLVVAGAAVAVVAAGWVVTADPVSAHAGCRSTGDRVTGLTANARVRCVTARAVAAAYDAAVMSGGNVPSGRVPAAGYLCRTTTVGAAEEETFAVRCTRRGGVVRFAWGV